MIYRLIGLAVAACALTALLLATQYRREPFVVSGFMEADEMRVGSRVGGRVAKVAVREGESVTQGQTLLELEPFDLEQRRSEAAAILEQRQAILARLSAGYRAEETAAARARVDQSAARLKRLENGPRLQQIEAAKAQVDQATAELQLAIQNASRATALFDKNAVTRDTLDQANSNLQASQARLRVREEELQLLQAGTREEDIAEARAQLSEFEQLWKLQQNGFRSEDLDEARGAVQAAEAALRIADRQIDELRVVSPAAGIVETIDLQPGDLVAPNAPALAIVDNQHLWIRCYVPENRLDLKTGQVVTITVDSFPNESFSGRITFVARRAEFTPSNVQTPEERSKQVFRVRVELMDGLDRLRPGMSADIRLGERDGS